MDWSENGCGLVFGPGPEYSVELYWTDGSTGTVTFPSAESALFASYFISQDVNAATWCDGSKVYTLCGTGTEPENWNEAVLEPGTDGGFKAYLTNDAGESWMPLCAVADGDVTGTLFTPDGFGLVGFSAGAGSASGLVLTRDGGIVIAVLLEPEDPELTRQTLYFRSDDRGESWYRLYVLGHTGYTSLEYGGVDTHLSDFRLGASRTTDAQLISNVLDALEIGLWEPAADTYTGESPILLTFSGDGAPCELVVGISKATVGGEGYAIPDGV